MCVEFVAGSILCSERLFSGYSGFFVSSKIKKPTFPNSNSTKKQVEEEPLSGCATSKSLFIYLFIYFIYLKYIYYDYSGTPHYDHPYITYSFVCPNGKLTLFL